MQRYFLPETLSVGQLIQLDADTQHHWVQVLRGKPGDQAEAVDAAEQLVLLTLTSATTAEVSQALENNVELPIEVTVVAGLPKQDKAEWIVQKATEMGAFDVVFFAADWSVAKWPATKVPKKLDRLTKIAKGAAQQSHRTHIPVVRFATKLTSAVAAVNADTVVVAYEEAAKKGEDSALYKLLTGPDFPRKLVVVFGPEGGISPAEIERLQADFGATLAGLGPRILRTETAPLYFLAAVSTLTELRHGE
ncbi:RsmE family RNA methyltransferase [Secundilactobacillus kimchicus]|uniref:RsmE family RNA methyltransferase n=1 Tax=Secundilactobacillus kimchicus TaxID=528209 RepID=UPI0024A994B5|nr:16S rRNA (uracil(1498)-N(3))-methyltransferase [Secundilactobacillus kimchicus]